jgi:hypothetical protein
MIASRPSLLIDREPPAEIPFKGLVASSRPRNPRGRAPPRMSDPANFAGVPDTVTGRRSPMTARRCDEAAPSTFEADDALSDVRIARRGRDGGGWGGESFLKVSRETLFARLPRDPLDV